MFGVTGKPTLKYKKALYLHIRLFYWVDAL